MTRIYENLPRCVSCGQIQGQPHACGCKFAKYTIRRVS